jgi:hypothetical protein
LKVTPCFLQPPVQGASAHRKELRNLLQGTAVTHIQRSQHPTHGAGEITAVQPFKASNRLLDYSTQAGIRIRDQAIQPLRREHQRCYSSSQMKRYFLKNHVLK